MDGFTASLKCTISPIERAMSKSSVFYETLSTQKYEYSMPTL